MRYILIGLAVSVLLNVAYLGIRFLREYKTHADPGTTFAVTMTVEPLRWLLYVFVGGLLLAAVSYGLSYAVERIRAG
jgi:hypothetical protein